jgi:hypothetical protein
MGVAADGESMRFLDADFDHCGFLHENVLDVP